ncbi:MAG TPA: efflux RND transporter periplasmic adaptor subunit [Gemmatimonadaceae bacterium]|nr:efflux RND transporter periplasmic adaptor subunit [Gemmatimonadaceae bacterium]
MTTTSILSGAPRVLAGTALALAVLGESGCRKNDASAEPTKTETMLVGPENVTVVRAEQIRTGPALSGSLAPERSATIRAEMSGAVLQTYAEAGQRVSAGQPLAQLDAAVLRDQQLSARGAVSTAQSNHDIAQRELSRNVTLEKAGAIAERDLERARNTLVGAQGQLATARAQLANVNKQLDKAAVRAPFSGVVAQRQVNAGDVVSPGAALFTVVDPGSMQLEASVPADALSQVRVGMPVDFKVTGYPDRSFTGRITRVNPTADPATRQVKIVASIPNAGNTLVGGLFAEGRVSSETRIAPMVPLGAVDERGLRPTVVRLKNGKIEKVEVGTGIRDAAAETVEITSGLAAGDTLLLGAARGISPGTPVRVSTPSDVKKKV